MCPAWFPVALALCSSTPSPRARRSQLLNPHDVMASNVCTPFSGIPLRRTLAFVGLFFTFHLITLNPNKTFQSLISLHRTVETAFILTVCLLKWLVSSATLLPALSVERFTSKINFMCKISSWFFPVLFTFVPRPYSLFAFMKILSILFQGQTPTAPRVPFLCELSPGCWCSSNVRRLLVASSVC